MNSRAISGMIAVIYMLLGYFTGGFKGLSSIAVYLILPMSCIWFCEEMGGYTGIGMGRGAITSTSPGCMVAFGGWLLLFLPVIVGAMMWMIGK